MKKLMFVVVLMLGVLMATSAFAVEPSFSVYTTDSQGNPDNEFGFNETPFLQINFPSTDWNVTIGWWTPRNGGETYLAANVFSGVFQDNVSFGDLAFRKQGTDTIFSWDAIKDYGWWDINATYNKFDGSVMTSNSAFNVVPEPVSSALFLIGGGAIALFRRNRRS